MKNRSFTFYILALLYLLVIITGLFCDMTGDAVKYAAITKNMVTDHQLLSLSIGTDLYNHKPPFLFWLEAPGQLLFGMNNFGTKIFPVLYTLIGIWALGKFTRKYYGSKAVKIVQLIYATTTAFLLYANDVHTDMVLTTNIILSVWWLSEYLSHQKWKHLLLASLALAMSVLTKGPIGFIIPFLGVGVHLLINKDWKRIFDWRWLILGVLVIIFILPYTLTLYKDFGKDGLLFFFISNTTSRMSGTISKYEFNPLYYLHTHAAMFLPWSVPGIVVLWKILSRPRQYKSKEYFSVGIIVLLTIILSISSKKAPNYMLPVIPFLSVLTGHYLSQLDLNNKTKLLKHLNQFQLVIMIAIVSLCALILFVWLPATMLLKSIFIAGVFLATFLTINQREQKLPLLFTTGISTMILLFFTINLHTYPELMKQNGAIKAAQIFNEHTEENTQLNNFLYGQFEHYFYATNKVSNHAKAEELRELKTKDERWLLTTQHGYGDLTWQGVPIKNKHQIEHVDALNHTFQFLLPQTRKYSKETLYLIEIDTER